MFAEDVPYRILVVEDSILNQHIIHKILSPQYVLAQACYAGEALKLVSEFEPHLILLDIILPDADGFDVLHALKQKRETRDIPVMIITGLDADEHEARGLSYGAVDYIKKPFNNEIVHARVNTQMRVIKQVQRAERLSMVDSLTGVPNRRAFDQRIKYEWSRAMRGKSMLSMMMLDVDHFKTYNDTYGHPQGDFMLQSIAGALRENLRRGTDGVYRYGGEEFCVILPTTGLAGAVHIAERVRQGVEQTKLQNTGANGANHVTVSIGVASMLPKKTDKLQYLIEKADEMLYKAKHQGRNQVQFE